MGAKHADAAPRPFQVDYSKQGGITARIREYRREKEICLQEARNEKEFKELEECTFQPNAGVKKSKPKPTKGVTEVVPGLGRHLELRRRAKQMEEEARARAAKVFLEDAAKKDVTHRQTVPRSPISANGGIGAKAEERRRRLLAEKEARRRPTARSGPRPTSDRARNSLRGCSRRRRTTWRSTGLPSPLPTPPRESSRSPNIFVARRLVTCKANASLNYKLGLRLAMEAIEPSNSDAVTPTLTRLW